MTQVISSDSPPLKRLLGAVPVYTPAKSMEQIRRELGLEEVDRLAANENPFGASPLATAAVRALTVEELAQYPDGSNQRLRDRLAEHVGVESSQLVLGSGSFELLTLTAQAYLNPGEESLVPTPSFGWYKGATLLAGGTVKEIPLTEHALNLETIEQQIGERTRIIWLCNPNNPTGTIFRAEELENFLEKVPSHIVVVLDEAYYEYAKSPDYPDSVALLSKYSNIIILRTFSKIYGLAGLRIGYGIGHEAIIRGIQRVQLPVNLTAASQAAALASLDDAEFVEHCQASNREGREQLVHAFEQWGLNYIRSETNFIMVDVEQDSHAVTEVLLKQGISVRGGAEFGMPTWLRITIGTPEQIHRLLQALIEVLQIST
ncbi:Histidinol-phosphate aminotransferase 2 [compost metagenome]